MNNSKDIIDGVIDYVEKNLKEELDLDKIADKAGYSKFHLLRMFSAQVGCTIHQYIVKRRMTVAAEELVSTDREIVDIALEAGYESQQSFSLAFKKLYSYPPYLYRARGQFEPVELRYGAPSSNINMNCEMKAA